MLKIQPYPTMTKSFDRHCTVYHRVHNSGDELIDRDVTYVYIIIIIINDILVVAHNRIECFQCDFQTISNGGVTAKWFIEIVFQRNRNSKGIPKRIPPISASNVCLSSESRRKLNSMNAHLHIY